ncbi:MAG TPA: MBL fold metallo-hydrolase [Candidatus Angelobacter sp.]|nr:MBL fold metallo-hydrolase [Candidatus Angelobacter sp.]
MAALLCLAAMFFPALCSADVRQIGPDLYAYISDVDSSANSTFLVTTEGILVVDTGANDKEAGKLLAAIRKISQAPIRYVINTHYHPDHTGGDVAVASGAVVFSTDFTLAKLASINNRAVAHERWITFPKAVSIYLGGHEIRLYHPGPAHTLGDVVVYFPDQRALATGDLFLNNSCPAMDEGDLENWIAALNHMLALPVDRVVPGHFELASRRDLEKFRNYLRDLASQVKAMHAKRMQLPEIQKSLQLDRYRSFRQYPNYEATFRDNAAAYYRQLEQRWKRTRDW